MTDTDEKVQNLLDLSDDTFRTLVEENVGPDAPPQLWQVLLDLRVVRRTHHVLTVRFRDVQDQLAQRKADMEAFRQECHERGPDGKDEWFAANGEHQQWRRRAIGYSRLLSARLAETRRVIGGSTPPPRPPDPARRVRQLETVFRLAWAIGEHRRQCLGSGVVPDAGDVELWRSLEHIEVETGSGLIPVAKFLEDLASKPGFSPPAPFEALVEADEIETKENV